MRLHISATAALAVGVLASGGATAQGISTEAEARAALFPAKGVRVVVFNLPGLSDTVKAAIGEQFRGQKYYGAFAVSLTGSKIAGAQASANHHSIGAAEQAALAACNASRTAGAAECRIAAHILPPGYEARALTLSADATAGFNNSYVGAGSPKALAISPSTGEWSIAKGQGAGAAATTSCSGAARSQGASDCRVVVGD
ncbi:5-aminolevulic acid synthase [Oceaniglobus indicus]|uniref:5-aminolevulic acid synthase n=1 Tax=Oceaniglobus indicus TaxID=2047749 RepID=UPI0011AB4BFD|nr:5-aminolevulic acid synthase [Oceaniglobus indicus]